MKFACPLLAGLALCLCCLAASAQTWQPPAPELRCPSRWGAQDERGAGNLQTPAQILKAARLIRRGEMFELSHVLAGDMPLFGTRRFDVTMKRTTAPMGTNLRRSNEELVVSEIGQVGTQFDAFPHQTIGSDLYNCHKLDEVATRTGFTKMGVDKVGGLFTRGILLDIAALKAVDILPIDYEITPEDLQAALRREGLTIEPGDAVLIHTGWGRQWGVDNARYNSGCPGIGVRGAQWLASQNIMLVGADNFPVEISPNPDPKLSLPVHQIALVINGIFLLENLRLGELAAAQAYEFALVLEPLKIKGGTGSTVAPVAIR